MLSCSISGDELYFYFRYVSLVIPVVVKNFYCIERKVVISNTNINCNVGNNFFLAAVLNHQQRPVTRDSNKILKSTNDKLHLYRVCRLKYIGIKIEKYTHEMF